MRIYDSIIIGGGPAGLSAAIYLARFNRSVLIVDKEEDARWDTSELNQNYLGFPEGIHSRQLRELGRKQALNFGAEYLLDEVNSVQKYQEQKFEILCNNSKFISRTIIFATGVKDLFPKFNDVNEYLGKSLFWCITCDGWKTRDKKVVVVGNTDEAAVTSMQFLNFTKDLVLVTNCSKDTLEISEKYLQRLKSSGIPVYTDKVDRINGSKGFIESIKLKSGQIISTDFIFNQQGAIPNSTLAKELNIDLDKSGYIKTDHEQKTNIPFVYAAGDVTKLFAHQIVTAAHEGSTAAQSANYDLYRPEQK